MSLILPHLHTHCCEQVENVFNHYLKKPSVAAPLLQEAMAYSVLNCGKRLRPLLVYAIGHALGASSENLAVPAAAIEVIHCYSLIHDDLPAMDNSNLRRGKLTCHKVYGDAVAILAGDALQALAFEILASYPASLDAAQRLSMIQTLSHASGPQGIAAGQTLDIIGVNHLSELAIMYQLKTGALLSACAKLAIIAAKLKDGTIIQTLENYTHAIGMAFQIQDDVLEIEADAATLGKPQGLDKANKKITYVSCMGIEAAKQKVKELFDSAIASIDSILDGNQVLLEFADYVLNRKK